MLFQYEGPHCSIVLGIGLIAVGLWALNLRLWELIGFAFDSETIETTITCKERSLIRESRLDRGNLLRAEQDLMKERYRYCIDSEFRLKVADKVDRQVGDTIQVTYLKSDPNTARVGGLFGTLFLWSAVILVAIGAICIGTLRIVVGVKEWKQSL